MILPEEHKERAAMEMKTVLAKYNVDVKQDDPWTPLKGVEIASADAEALVLSTEFNRRPRRFLTEDKRVRNATKRVFYCETCKQFSVILRRPPSRCGRDDPFVLKEGPVGNHSRACRQWELIPKKRGRIILGNLPEFVEHVERARRNGGTVKYKEAVQHLKGKGLTLEMDKATFSRTVGDVTRASEGKNKRSAKMVDVEYLPDEKRQGGCVVPSPSITATFVGGGGVSSDEARSISTRLDRWDPYWREEYVIEYSKTTVIRKLDGDENAMAAVPKQALVCNIVVPQSYKEIILLARNGPEESNVRLMLHMLPVTPPTNSADCCLWPKGTFAQIDGHLVKPQQRAQRSHKRTRWDWACKPLDLTEEIRTERDTMLLKMHFVDDEPYFLRIAVCTKVLTAEIRDRIRTCEMKTPSWDEARQQAASAARMMHVALDGTEVPELTMDLETRLTCPISMLPIGTPVRGVHCTHWRCFDLAAYVEMSSYARCVRWRCPICNKLTPMWELTFCPITSVMLMSGTKTDRGSYNPATDAWKLYCRESGRWLVPQARGATGVQCSNRKIGSNP
jgi:hypothetical protein